MIALNFNCAISHLVDGLIDNDRSMRLSHNLVDLVALGADKERDHALRDKDNDGKGLSPNLFENLVNIIEENSATLIFFFHFFIVNLDL